MSLVFVALGFMGFFAATMLAIDVGMLMTARSQAQNSADAGALAGAVAMAFEDFDDHNSTGPAVTGAIRQATANQVMYTDVSVKPEDVEFLQDARGIYSQVRVTVHRNAERGNPVNTVIASLFGINTANINAVATAQVSPADRPARCFPFMIPDKWRELTAPPFNSVDSTFDLFNKKVPLPNPDQYVDATHLDGYTGYDQNIDTGTVIVLKRGSGTNVSPSQYNPFRIPGNGEGADRYREAILNGPCGNMKFGDRIEPETGDMVGPTKQGVDDLITKYPDARWDTSCQCARGNPEHIQMREGVIPLYDPDFYERGKQTGNPADFRAAGFLGVFLEGMDGNDVRARVVPVAGTRSEDGPWPEHSFLKAIQLIK
jgi:hypothetical protein